MYTTLTRVDVPLATTAFAAGTKREPSSNLGHCKFISLTNNLASMIARSSSRDPTRNPTDVLLVIVRE